MPKDQSTATAANPEKPGRGRKIEKAPAFVATPERMSQLFEMKIDDVYARLQSMKGREELANMFREHADHIRSEIDPNFDLDRIPSQLELGGQTLEQNKRFLEQIKVPEKQGAFRRAFERVKGFAKKHKVVTALLVLAAATAAVGGTAYALGGWEILLERVGLSALFGPGGAAEAGRQIGNIISAPDSLPYDPGL